MASQREMPVKYSPYKKFFSNLRANTGHPRYSKNESKYDTFLNPNEIKNLFICLFGLLGTMQLYVMHREGKWNATIV